MIGFSDLLLSDLKNYPLDVIEEQIKYISNSAKNTFNLIENLLQWSRSQRGMIKFKPMPVNVPETINSELKVLSRQALLKNIKIEFHVSGTETAINLDTALLQIIIRNLVSNAIKYSFNNSTIDITAKFEKKQLVISVQDYGVGISEEVKESIFVIHERTLPGTEGESGTGLGLLLCKDFVEMHGGKLYFESEKNNGSKFEFTIPAKIPIAN
jgi:signal transduction histidine kinase